MPCIAALSDAMPSLLLSRRAALALCAAATLVPGLLCAQSAYPSKPIKLIVPYAAGGAVDIYARIVQPKLAQQLGQPVIVENKPGASGMLGADAVAKADPDGYTLLVGNIGNLAMNVPLYAKMSYDPVRDFTPLLQTVQVHYVLAAAPSLPVHSVPELIAYAQSHPGQVAYASSGAGSAQHMAAALFQSRTGTQLLHVPYKGTGAIVADLIAGHVQIAFADQSSMMPQVKAGKLRALAVAGANRSADHPDLPAIAETPGLSGYEAVAWQGIAAPAQLPAPIRDRLVQAFTTVQAMPAIRAKLQAAGLSPVQSDPAHFAAYIRSEIAHWSSVAQQAQITVD